MGVIRNVSNLQASNKDSIEEVLEQIEDLVQNTEVEVRRPPRRVKHRSPRSLAVGDCIVPRKGGRRRRQRIDNTNYLLSLVDPEEPLELSIDDFIAPSISVFSRIYEDHGHIEMWNQFINCTNPDWIESIIVDQTKILHSEKLIQEKPLDDPAYIAAQRFKKIDTDLRLLLKKKHVPLGALIYLEREVVAFFMNRPQSIFHSFVPNSFERVLLHALCQYMDLGSLSYNRNGERWTRVRNTKETFEHPLVLLSTYLERRMTKNALTQ